MATAAGLVPALSHARTGAWRAVALAAVALSGCAGAPGIAGADLPQAPEQRPPEPEPTAPAGIATPARSAKPAPPRVQTGPASWYGKFHHGRPTASGERFDMHALTAAHPWLPLGTRLRVTNLTNGRSVSVRVNDRGPIVPGRIIDLSYAAARRLDAVEDGTVTVRLRVLGEPDDTAPPVPGRRDAWSASLVSWLWARAPVAPPPSMPSPVTSEMPEGAQARSTRLLSRRS